MTSVLDAQLSLSAEEKFRAHFYLLLSRLLGAPADAELLGLMQELEGDGSAIGEAITDLKKLAANISVDQSAEEYEAIFIGVTQGELTPFKSYYLTGFLNEKPLAELRQHMDELGIEKSEDAAEPEDHIAFLCEMMHGLIVGSFGKPLALPEQYRFFENHIANWAPKFFEDLETTESARLYAPIGRIGKLFMEVESEAFLIAA
ncbi:MAG: molecular chaperone TorD family protein [Rhodospirillales bacterium]|nr:molecular chaperone TorD family protein [Rhodospirillales bacterium]